MSEPPYARPSRGLGGEEVGQVVRSQHAYLCLQGSRVRGVEGRVKKVNGS